MPRRLNVRNGWLADSARLGWSAFAVRPDPSTVGSQQAILVPGVGTIILEFVHVWSAREQHPTSLADTIEEDAATVSFSDLELDLIGAF